MPTLLYHVYPINNWRQITEQVFRFSSIFDRVLISVAGHDTNGDVESFTTGLSTVHTELRGIDEKLHEPDSWNTHFLPEILSRPNDTYFYCHSKGVTRPDNTCVEQWREMMLYFLLEKHANYIAPKISHYGFVGIEKKPGRPGAGCRCSWYYAGNFWWMNPSMLDQSLLVPLKVMAKKRRGRRHGQPRSSGQIKTFYNTQALEALPGKFPTESGLCLYGTSLDLYRDAEPRSKYENATLCEPGCTHPFQMTRDDADMRRKGV